ncbi:glycosyltransferase family 1 protein [Mariprofundus erugo]|uniref:glycosyltransferase n=1 Tax=Mariprofundus erugo TaxID=2528639 RepID=UPI0010FEF655|nr:glycosyltransferase [Mariprofundus erugo]TLS78403.1 glycosyltransferase family 1 protein [Mariprofundus erugo]
MTLKVLHIVESFNGQATEKWLGQLIEEANRRGQGIDWTIFCILNRDGNQEEIKSLGGKVMFSAYPVSRTFSFMKGLRKIVKHGKFDVVHSHHDLMSAVYFMALIGLPIGKRIIHIHNTSLSLPTSSKLKAAFLKRMFRSVCRLLADHVVGVSDPALDAFRNKVDKRKVSPEYSVIHCGVDLSKYKIKQNIRQEFRSTLPFPSDAMIILFVGRLIDYKNPYYVLDVLVNLPENLSGTCAVFVGIGPLEAGLRKRVIEMSLQDRVVILGWRNDAFQIMQSSDLLLWPSIENPMEGLGLGVVEAQAAGLRVLMSRSVPSEAIIIPEMVDVIPLSVGPRIWAEQIARTIKRRPIESDMCLERVRNSSFNISNSLSSILELYEA